MLIKIFVGDNLVIYSQQCGSVFYKTDNIDCKHLKNSFNTTDIR